MSTRRLSTTVLILLCLTITTVQAQTVGIQGGGPFPSIQSAVDAATNGATIIMSTGTFFETVIVSNKHLSLEGGWHTDLLSRPGGYTAIDAAGVGTTLWFIKSRTSRVDQVNLVGGAGWPLNLWSGGGCLLHQSTVEFNDTAFASNTAWNGGGLFVGLFSYAKLDGASRVFTNTAAFKGGGIYVDGRADVVHEDADVFDNHANDGDGGGIFVASGYLRLFQADVYRNFANTAGGVDPDPSGGGVGAAQSFVEMGDGATISNNFASWGGGIALIASTGSLGRSRNDDVICVENHAWRGGGLFATNCEISVSGLTVSANSANGVGTEFGGGIHAIFSTLQSDTNLLRVNANTTDGRGGGLSLESCTANFHKVEFGLGPGWGNNAWGSGGGIYATNSRIDIQGGLFMANTASNSGGAIALDNSFLSISNVGTFYTASKRWPTHFWMNNASTNGGAISAGNSDVQIRHAAFTENSSHGGTIHFSGPRMLALSDTVVADNWSIGGFGAVTLMDSATGRLFSCTVYSNGNTFLTMYGIWGDNFDVSVSHSIIWGHGNGSLATGGVVQSSLIEGGWPGASLNITNDPQVYPSRYHLTYASPCIDAGVAWGGADVDIDGEARSGNYDLGSDEWQDGDGDKLPDIVETDTGFYGSESEMGSDPANPDTDSDGIGDGDEWISDTDPNKGDEYLRLSRMWYEGGMMKVELVGGVNAYKILESASSPTDTIWSTETTFIPPTAVTNEEQFLNPTLERTYRVRAHR